MPTPPNMTTISSISSSSLKLRSSCDSCGTAKVKCDREQPGCGRCINLGLACVYGPSRQIGKPPRKRPISDFEEMQRCEKRLAHSDESASFQTASSGAELSSSIGSGLVYSSLVPDMSSNSLGSTNTLRPDVNQFHTTFFSPLFMDDFDGFGFDVGTNLASKTSAIDNRRSSPVVQPGSFSTINPTSRQSHSCPRDSYEIFRDLVRPSPSLHAPESGSDPVSAQLDQVLCFTRDAIAALLAF